MKYLVRGCNKAISADLVHNEEIESPDVVKQKEEDTGLARHREPEDSSSVPVHVLSTLLSTHFLSYKMGVATRTTPNHDD